jgi:hypothetical protein
MHGPPHFASLPKSLRSGVVYLVVRGIVRPQCSDLSAGWGRACLPQAVNAAGETPLLHGHCMELAMS